MDTWAQKSDEAARDVFSTMSGMLGFPEVQTRVRQPGPQSAAETKGMSRPVSDLVSELGSRESLLSQHTVSILGAETEPPWLLAATQKDSWPRCDSQVVGKPPTQRSNKVEGNASSVDGREVLLAGTYPPPVQTYAQPLPSYPDSAQLRPPTKASVIISPSYLRPQAQRPSYWASSIPKVPPKVTIQMPMVQTERRPVQHMSKPTEPAPQHDQCPQNNTTKPLPALPVEVSTPYPPLTALLYFSLELPRSKPHHNGSYLRHHAHPMRLPLATPQQLVASTTHLRGYLKEQPARFLSHFASYTSPHTSTDKETRLVVHFPSLFRAGGSHSVERIWGTEMAWAWADASEGMFAEAVVGVLREVAEVTMREGKGGGVVDVVCVVREVVDGRKGYGLLMDVRRIREEETRMRVEQKNEKKAEKKRQKSCERQRQTGGKMVRGGEKMWIH